MTTDQAQQHAAHGIERLAQPPQSRIRRTIAVMSGKGGVGKSTVTALLAVALAKAGKKVGILDADITGPSIPRLFGVTTEPVAMPIGLVPPESRLKIRIMSVNLLLANEDDPVVWRGPVIAGTVRQFWSEVVWGELDYLLVDLPPGTGDAPLTVMQSLPLDGIVVVTAPQELSVMVVKKAVKMASMLNIPLFGLLENMSYVSCPDCGRRIELFGPSHAKEAAESMGLAFLGSMPIDPQLTALADHGAIEDYQLPLAAELAADIDRAVNRD